MAGILAADRPPVLEDFDVLKVLGKGSYGKVMLVKHRDREEVFAMKMLHKDHLVKRNQVEHTMTERSVLESVSHPFIVNLHFAFQTPKKLYMILEFCSGGELFFHLSRAGRFSESRTKFYCAEILLAIEYLHSLRIIYRDLKPENLLLDHEGHVKITDFGLSKEGIQDNVSAQTVCGTPEYLAPEILDKKGHGRAVDWYSLGALMFEMLTGLPPYYSKDKDQLFARIRRGDLSYPSFCSKAAVAMMKGLLYRDPDRRIGGGDTDGEEVKSHPFWASTDWAAVLHRKLTPPFVPEKGTDTDPKYVDKEFLDLPVVNSEVPDGPGVMDDKHFEGFTFDAAA